MPARPARSRAIVPLPDLAWRPIMMCFPNETPETAAKKVKSNDMGVKGSKREKKEKITTPKHLRRRERVWCFFCSFEAQNPNASLSPLLSPASR